MFQNTYMSLFKNITRECVKHKNKLAKYVYNM